MGTATGMGDMTVREAGRKGGTKVRDSQPPDFYARIGRKGGKAVKAKRGAAYFSEIGKLGGAAIKRIKGGEHFSEIGTLGGNAVKDSKGRDYFRQIGRMGVKSRWAKAGITGPTPRPVKRVGVSPNAKLTVAKVKEIRQRSLDGAWQTELAAEYGVTPVTISHVVTRRTWRWVD